MIISTGVLDRAAFFMTFGAKLMSIDGKYPQNIFVIETNRLVALYEAMGGWLPYRRFCNLRRDLKRKSRKQSGLPEYFTGNKNLGFEFGDIARVIKWNKKGQ